MITAFLTIMGRSATQRLKAEETGLYDNEEGTGRWIGSQC